MGGIVSSPKAPAPPPPPAPMPDADDTAILQAKKRATADQVKRSGRASTILSTDYGSSGKLGA